MFGITRTIIQKHVYSFIFISLILVDTFTRIGNNERNGGSKSTRCHQQKNANWGFLKLSL